LGSESEAQRAYRRAGFVNDMITENKNELRILADGRVRMRTTILAVVAIVVLSAASILAQDALPKSMEDAQPVNIHLRNAPVSELFKILGATSGVDIRTEGGDRPVNVNFTNAKVSDVFNFFITAGHWTYKVVDEKTIIVTVTPEP
jgi:hypothetical protein